MKRRSQLPLELTDDVSIIRNHNFNRLWGAQILSQIAQNLLTFALVIRVFQLADGTRLANISVALLILSFGIPSIFFAAAAGVYVDHWNKRHVLIVANALRALLVLGYMAFEANLYLVLLLSFVISTATQFFVPAEAAAIPALVKGRHLQRANSLFLFTMYASFVVGYSASGPVIAAFGNGAPYILTAIMFGLSAALVWALPAIRVQQSQRFPFDRIASYTWQEIRNNWRIIRSNHSLSFPILQLTLSQAVLGVLLALAPALSQAVLGLPLQHASHYLVIPAGIGMVVGVILIERLTARIPRLRLIAVGFIAAAAALFLLGASDKLRHLAGGHALLAGHQIGLIIAPLVFILGFTNAIVSTAAQTLLQEHAPEHTRGKVFGALSMLINVAATLPIFFAGILADLFGVPAVVSTLGLGLLGFSIIQYIFLVRQRKI